MPKDAIVVPDAHLLFHGDFKRSGVDLILSEDDREIVLHDYFKGEKRAALSSPDGAHLTGDLVNALAGSVQVSQADGSASVAKVIGHVTKLVGSATATRNGVSIILHQGDNVEKGDVVQSGSDSTLGITFIDGTVFGLSSNARMVLNDMVYDPNGSNNSSLLSLVAGTISFVAGETAKHGDMKIDTPVATMGIRGTAVLVEIDFTAPGQGGQPDAKFQVLVEPDGTTGSYILFDKTTLQPLAVVNTAGQQINISQGVITQTNVPLSPDVQKLINDVFTLKFTDNTNPNPKTNFGQNNSITPETGPVIKTADSGSTATPTYLIVNQNDTSKTGTPSGPTIGLVHIPGPPEARLLDLAGHLTSSFSIQERAGLTGKTDLDNTSGKVNFADLNAGDTPTVKVAFSAFAYQNAQHQDVTAKLTLLQLADVAATEVKIAVVADPGNKNTGSATFTYTVPDNMFDFLAAGETLTLTYVARVDNNFAPLNETTLIPFTITVTGTNDAPVITTGPQTIAFHGGTSEPGGSLPLTSNDPTSGTLTFTDVDLTDTHTVKFELTNKDLPPTPLGLFEQALSVSLAKDSTGTGNGTVNWTFAALPVWVADFIPANTTLTLTYIVTVTDEHGVSASQTITVNITGTAPAAEVWIHTTGDGSPDGLWSTGKNWETGNAPTAGDDVIIITDQLQHLTPSYPVTIDTQAVAHTVTMNDFSDDYPDSAPKLIVARAEEDQPQNSLTIGSDFTLSVDAEVDNYGIISVGGVMKVLGGSILNNHGALTLKQGGDFEDHASITNSGTIEVKGKAPDAADDNVLNVAVNIDNSGTIQVDTGATLVLNSSIITGGTVVINGTLELDGTSFLKSGTLNNFGTVDVEGAVAFDAETVNNGGTIEISAGHALTVDQNSVVKTIGDGAVTVDNAGKLTLDDASIDGGTVTSGTGGEIDLTGSAVVENGALDNAGAILVSGIGNALHHETVTANTMLEVLAGGALTIGQISTIANGTIQVDAASDDSGDNGGGQLTLSAATVTGGTVTNQSGGEIDLAGGGVIQNGSLGNAGRIKVSGIGNALHAETVSANAMLEVLAGGVLLLDLGTTIANSGTITVDGGATLTLNAATISGGTINDYSFNSPNYIAGSIDVTGSSTINEHAILNKGGVTVASGVTLTLGNVTVNGTAFSDAGATLSVGAGQTLILQNGATVTGGSLVISGTLRVETSSGAHLDHVTVSGGGAIVVDDDSTALPGTLFLADGTSITGGTLTIGGLGTLDVETGAALHHVDVSDGNVIAVGATTTAVLSLDGGTTITGGGLKFGDDSDQLVVEKGANDLGATLDGVAVSGGGDVKIGVTSTGAVLVLDDEASITGGALAIGAGSTLEIAAGAHGTGAMLDAVSVDNSGAVKIDAGATLALVGTNITGGTLTITGELDATGSIVITSSVVNTGTIEVKSGTLDLEGGLSGSGQIIIDAGAKLEIAGSYVPTVTFHSPNAELQIDTATFAGNIGGLAATDQLDLRTIQYHLGTTATYTSNPWHTGGVLTVTDTHGDSISLTLVGHDYSNAHFAGSTDNNGGTLITLNANDDAPVITTTTPQTASVSEAANTTGSSTPDPQPPASASGSISFTDVDLTDRPTATIETQSAVVVWTDAGQHDISSQLTPGEISALEQGLSLDSSANTNNGTIGWSYMIADSALDFLGQGQTVTVDSTITLDDHQGGSATTHVNVTITGAEDQPIITSETQTGAIAEIPGVSGSMTPDTATGTITFTDADVTDTHSVTISNVTASGAYAGLPDNGTILSWLSLGSLTDSQHGATGSSTWTFSAQDKTFDYLSAGQTVTLTYTAVIDDGHGGVVSAPVTITVTGTDDAPTIVTTSTSMHTDGDDGRPHSGGQKGALTEMAGKTGSEQLDRASGTIYFADRDGTDTHGVTVTGVSVSGDAARLPDGAELMKWLSLGPLTDTTGGKVGSEPWTFSAQDKYFDYLPAGKSVTLTYTVQIDDHHSGKVTTPVTITITGTDDAPTILGETDPSIQTIVLAKSAIALPSTEAGNDLGLPTETFDQVSYIGDGEAHTSFYSSTLHATFTASGSAGIVQGSSPASAAPFVGPPPGHADSTPYLTIGAQGQETISFDSAQNTFGLYWGSVDSYNTIGFYKGDQLIASYTGSDLGSLVTSGGQNSFTSNGYVEFKDLAPFDKVVLGSSQNAFELDDVSAGYVSDSHIKLANPVGGTLVVADHDVGDKLTASVTGKATVTYNGSTQLPANINVDALTDAKAVSFDSVTSDGKADVLHWTYHPTGANLDFLEPGDTLKITFNAQVSDGHVTAGSQPLTVTIAGNGSTVVNGTAGNDSFDDIGGGVTVFGNGGHDTFVFNASFGSATIGDFNVDRDVIEIDKSLFKTVDALLMSAQSPDGHDTVITDATHETITLKGVTVAQLTAHANDFHII